MELQINQTKRNREQKHTAMLTDWVDGGHEAATASRRSVCLTKGLELVTQAWLVELRRGPTVLKEIRGSADGLVSQRTICGLNGTDAVLQDIRRGPCWTLIETDQNHRERGHRKGQS
jgi:hypothetical protein